MSDLRWVIVDKPQLHVIVFASGIMMILQQLIVSSSDEKEEKWETVPITMGF